MTTMRILEHKRMTVILANDPPEQHPAHLNRPKPIWDPLLATDGGRDESELGFALREAFLRRNCRTRQTRLLPAQAASMYTDVCGKSSPEH